MTRRIIRQQIELSVHFILSMVECGIYFAEPDTILVFIIFSELFKEGNPPCNAEHYARRTYRH